jgi:hypothetical protein
MGGKVKGRKIFGPVLLGNWIWKIDSRKIEEIG